MDVLVPDIPHLLNLCHIRKIEIDLHKIGQTCTRPSQREFQVLMSEVEFLLAIFDRDFEILPGHQFDHDEISHRFRVCLRLLLGHAVLAKTASKRIEREHHCLDLLPSRFFQS